MPNVENFLETSESQILDDGRTYTVIRFNKGAYVSYFRIHVSEKDAYTMGTSMRAFKRAQDAIYCKHWRNPQELGEVFITALVMDPLTEEIIKNFNLPLEKTFSSVFEFYDFIGYDRKTKKHCPS